MMIFITVLVVKDFNIVGSTPYLHTTKINLGGSLYRSDY